MRRLPTANTMAVLIGTTSNSLGSYNRRDHGRAACSLRDMRSRRAGDDTGQERVRRAERCAGGGAGRGPPERWRRSWSALGLSRRLRHATQDNRADDENDHFDDQCRARRVLEPGDPRRPRHHHEVHKGRAHRRGGSPHGDAGRRHDHDQPEPAERSDRRCGPRTGAIVDGRGDEHRDAEQPTAETGARPGQPRRATGAIRRATALSRRSPAQRHRRQPR